MSGESRNLGNYGTERNLVPAGTTGLLAVTIMVVALACALGAYVLSTQALQQLQQQGYQFWMSTSFDSFVNLTDLSGSSWVLYQPGQHLALAFTTPPLSRAIFAFLGIAGGGITVLVAARHFDSASRKHPGLLIGIVLLFFGLQAALLGPPHGISIDLPSQQLTDGSTNVPLSTINGFGTYTYHGRHSHGTELFVQSGGDDTTLLTYSMASDAVAAQNVMQNFVTSHGGQL